MISFPDMFISEEPCPAKEFITEQVRKCMSLRAEVRRRYGLDPSHEVEPVRDIEYLPHDGMRYVMLRNVETGERWMEKSGWRETDDGWEWSIVLIPMSLEALDRWYQVNGQP